MERGRQGLYDKTYSFTTSKLHVCGSLGQRLQIFSAPLPKPQDTELDFHARGYLRGCPSRGGERRHVLELVRCALGPMGIHLVQGLSCPSHRPFPQAPSPVFT